MRAPRLRALTTFTSTPRGDKNTSDDQKAHTACTQSAATTDRASMGAASKRPSDSPSGKPHRQHARCSENGGEPCSVWYTDRSWRCSNDEEAAPGPQPCSGVRGGGRPSLATTAVEVTLPVTAVPAPAPAPAPAPSAPALACASPAWARVVLSTTAASVEALRCSSALAGGAVLAASPAAMLVVVVPIAASVAGAAADAAGDGKGDGDGTAAPDGDDSGGDGRALGDAEAGVAAAGVAPSAGAPAPAANRSRLTASAVTGVVVEVPCVPAAAGVDGAITTSPSPSRGAGGGPASVFTVGREARAITAPAPAAGDCAARGVAGVVCSSVPPVAALTAVITPHSGGCNAGSGVSGEWLNEKMGGTGIGTKGSRLDSSA